MGVYTEGRHGHINLNKQLVEGLRQRVEEALHVSINQEHITSWICKSSKVFLHYCLQIHLGSVDGAVWQLIESFHGELCKDIPVIAQNELEKLGNLIEGHAKKFREHALRDVEAPWKRALR